MRRPNPLKAQRQLVRGSITYRSHFDHRHVGLPAAPDASPALPMLATEEFEVALPGACAHCGYWLCLGCGAKTYGFTRHAVIQHVCPSCQSGNGYVGQVVHRPDTVCRNLDSPFLITYPVRIAP